jgi:tetratricopeptide (TPR) repeat protein
MKPSLVLLLSYVALCGLVACGQKQALLQKNPTLEAAERLEHRGAAAYQKGDLTAAFKDYETASLVYESLALPEPFAAVQLNLARLDAENGRVDAAIARVVQVQQLSAEHGVISDQTQLLANGRAAALYMQRQNWAMAHTNLVLAERACAEVCEAVSALWVMRARLELNNNQLAAARESATTALARARNAVERANALRSRAQIGLADKLGALADAKDALKLDQEIGQSSRVIADLELLHLASAQASDVAAEKEYLALLVKARVAKQKLGAR